MRTDRRAVTRIGISWFFNRVNLLIAIILLLLLGTALLSFFEQITLFEAFYMLIISVTTVGYGDLAPETSTGRALMLAFIPVGLLLVFGLGVSLATERLDDLILRGGMGRLERRIAKMKDHFIVCGYGRLGREITNNLVKLGCPVVVIDKDRERVAEIEDALFIVGDALREDVLERAGIHRARALVSTFSDDTLNVYLVLEASDVAPEIDVVSTASDREATRRLYLAGATRVVSPQVMGADIIAKSAYNPSVYQLMSDMISGATPADNINQVVINPGSQLVGRRLREFSEMGVEGARVMLIKKGDKTILSPSGEAVLEPGSVLVVFGKADDIDQLETLAVKRA